MEHEQSKDGVIHRRAIRNLGIFLDGPALDRACKRLGRKIDLKGLVKTVSAGLTPMALRYYTLVPHEDDSRHRAFLGAVAGAGFETVVKRLPPKGINKQVSIDIEITADMMAFGQGFTSLPRLDAREGNDQDSERPRTRPQKIAKPETTVGTPTMVVICPSKELLYPLTFLKDLGIPVSVADFMPAGNSEFIKACKSWIDLSDADRIWRS